MANSSNGKRNGRPTGTAKGSSTARTPSTTGARTGTTTSATRAVAGAKTAPVTATSTTGSRLAGIRERSGQSAAPRKVTQSRRIDQRPWYRSGGAIWATVAVVLVAIIVFVAISHGSGSDQYYTKVSSTVLNEVTNVSPTTLATVGAGGLTQGLTASPANTPLNKDASGKPIVLFIGAEYCPYCAGERWSLIIALSRFGTFTNLHNMVSSDSEGDISSLPTFTFRGATYTSQYFTFQSVEMEDRYEAALEDPTDAQNKIFNTYDYAPYVDSSSAGGIPFVSYGNQYFAHSAGYSVQVLAGSTRDQIASQLNTAANPVTQSIEGNANNITAAICKLTNNQPASVCVTDPSSTVKNPIPALVKALPAQS